MICATANLTFHGKELPRSDYDRAPKGASLAFLTEDVVRLSLLTHGTDIRVATAKGLTNFSNKASREIHQRGAFIMDYAGQCFNTETEVR